MAKNKRSWARHQLLRIMSHLHPQNTSFANNFSDNELSSSIDSILQSKWKLLPDGQNNDLLYKFITDDFFNNILASYSTLSPDYKYLQNLFECFKAIDNKIKKDPKNEIGTQLFFRGASAYSSACITSMAGQTSETHVLLRSCLEYGAYSFYIYIDPSSRESIWNNRKTDKNKMTREFSHSNICNAIKGKDENLAEKYKNLYEATIDYGAHPNKKAIDQGSFIKENELGFKVGQSYLTGNTEIIKELMNITAQTGLLILQIGNIILSDTFKEHGITETLEQIKKYFTN